MVQTNWHKKENNLNTCYLYKQKMKLKSTVNRM